MFKHSKEKQKIRQAIAEDCARGMRGPELVKKYGMSLPTISRACRDFGHPLTPGAKRTLPDPAPRACGYCGREFTPRRKKPNQRFCSIPCACRFRLTPEHNTRIARENRLKISESRRASAPETKGYRKFLGRHEHRVVMESMIGRPLKKGEIVHHIDENKRNNHPSNLQLLQSQAEHARLHNLQRRP